MSREPPWTETTLGKIAKWGSGGTPSRRNPEFFKGSIPWIKTGELGKKYIQNCEEYISEEAICRSSAKLFKKGSVGIAMYGATIGKLSIFDIDASTNQACAVAEPKEGLDKEFLYYFLLSERRSLIKAGKGGAQPNISQSILKDWPIRLPTISEQKNIVAKIEALFSELDKGIESLKTARQQLKAYRQAVLKHAFEGKLTEKWRQQNPDKLESPEQLLARIQQEREQCYQRQLEEWKQDVKAWEDNGKEGKKPSKPKLNSAIRPLEDNALLSLPDGWVWVELSTIIENIQIGPFGSLLHKADYVADGVPLVNPSHIKNQKVAPDWNLTVTEEKLNGLRKYVMQSNDIVIGRRGEMGRCAVITNKESGWLCGTGSLFVRPLSIANSDFYSWIITSQRVKDHLSNSSIGTTMQNLNEKILKGIPVPVCSIEEQDEIIRQISSQYSAIDKLEEEIDAQIMKSETLHQSILKKAFCGQITKDKSSIVGKEF
ncbi:restriction endonuclease subunit S [Nitrosomonas sp. ANs5]|uniref:restriction endonuclease subunit S n=1 Tax=Nitrosomonas sp. ANs5 TaxID=3423941 RepID=UPI003D355FA2